MNQTFQEVQEMTNSILYSIAITASQNTHRILYHTISYCIRNAPKSIYGFEGLTGDNLCRAVARANPTSGWYTPITCDERLHNFVNGRTVLVEMLIFLALITAVVIKLERLLSR